MLIQMRSPNGQRLWTAVREGSEWHHAWSELGKPSKRLKLRKAPEGYVDAMRMVLRGLGWLDNA